MTLLTKITNSWLYRGRDIFFIAGIGVLVYFVIHKPTVVPPQITNPVQLKAVDSMRDTNGKLYAKVAQQTLQLVQIQSYADSLAKALKIKPKYIQGVDRVVTVDSVVYNNIPVTEKIDEEHLSDTLQIYTIEKHDPWTDIKATLDVKRDTASVEYKSRDTLTRVEVAETHLFSPTTYTVYMGNSNPYNDIKEGASFQIKEKRAWLSIGPDLQYNPFTNKLNLGISVQLPLLQFKK